MNKIEELRQRAIALSKRYDNKSDNRVYDDFLDTFILCDHIQNGLVLPTEQMEPMIATLEEALGMLKRSLKAFIGNDGDPSVGIDPWETSIVLNDVPSEFFKLRSVERTQLRQELKNAFKDIYGEDAVEYVRFEDECFDCGKPSCSGECVHGEIPW